MAAAAVAAVAAAASFLAAGLFLGCCLFLSRRCFQQAAQLSDYCRWNLPLLLCCTAPASFTYRNCSLHRSTCLFLGQGASPSHAGLVSELPLTQAGITMHLHCAPCMCSCAPLLVIISPHRGSLHGAPPVGVVVIY